MTDDANSATDAGPASSHGFTADVARLLQLMAHSVYSERDVFLRELVANAADASPGSVLSAASKTGRHNRS